jgi:2-polyprenyl-3-methyl-5-hydroxy-6-metoxy-1,4-benzoquinol methylase
VSYSFASDERARLEAVEDLLDDGTERVLERLGIAAGWHCLEVGAGGGSIARWLADRVGPGGKVVATDLNIGNLGAEPGSVVEVRQHDVVRDALDEGAFDLVHTRLVLEHLPSREEVLRKLVRALKPGGWLVVEDVDYVSGVPISEHGAREHSHSQEVRLRLFSELGADPLWGRWLPARLREASLSNVGNEGRVWVMEGGSPGARWFKLSLAHLRPRLVGPGKLTEEEVTRMLELFDDPSWSAFSPIIVAAWGQRAE